MPTILESIDAPNEVYDLAADIIRAYYPGLTQAGVTFAYFWATNTRGVPLKLHGYPCAAVVKITPYEQRVDGAADCKVFIDQDHWDGLSEKEKRALLDHECGHVLIVPQTEKFLKRNPQAVSWKQDDLGRPKLKMKKHDIQIGGFLSIIERYEESAIEYQSLKTAGEQVRRLTQKTLWG